MGDTIQRRNNSPCYTNEKNDRKKPQAKRFRKGEHKEATKGSTLREQWLRGGGYFGSTLLRWGQLKDEQMGVLARYY
jgi:hypothetical protein